MNKNRWAFVGKLAGLVVLGLVLVALAACGQNSGTTTSKSPATAMGSLSAARSALTTMAPDAKLLVVQTMQAETPTSTPVWGYIFGSPSNSKAYIVYATNGKVMGAQEYGTISLTKADWGKVPGTDVWKIDSPEAYTKALKVSGAKGDPNAYMMGMTTFKPANDTSTVEPWMWNVQFDPGASGATTSTILVNAKTGDTSISK